MIYVSAAVLFIGPMIGFEFSWWLLDEKHVQQWSPVLLAACFIGAFGYYLYLQRESTRPTTHAFDRSAFIVFITAAILQMAAWRVVGSHSVFYDTSWDLHFDAVIYTVSQVVMGKTLLYDLPSQYGLAPEILAPIFKLVRLTTRSFTSVCAILQLVSLLCVWRVLERNVRDRALLIFTSLALVMVTFETVLFVLGLVERYYQYWPIRFFWPAVSVAAFHRYSKSETLASGAWVSIISAVAVLWNADSGAMVVIAFSAFLIFKLAGTYLAPGDLRAVRRKLWMSLALHCVIVAVLIAAFLFYLSLKAAGPLHWNWLFEYQLTFYKLGFMMLPMPTYPSAWMTVIAVYLMGLCVSFTGLVRGRRSTTLDDIIYLSLLGLGLFVYFQGRSHILNIITVCWPAVIVGAMLADRVLRLVRARRADRSALLLPAVALGLSIFCAVPFIWKIPKFVNSVHDLYVTRKIPMSPQVQSEIDFIRAHSKPGQACEILAIRQGTYYTEARLVSPLSGPGNVETVLQRDRDSMVEQFQTLRPTCVFLGRGTASQDFDPRINETLKSYGVMATNDTNTIQYLVPLK
ncbi:hypothetical protein CEY04_20490 [Achromobacter sp. HZ28]|nr:hypothetical protein CEY04_20490 [Achromobacter sp. HZ28]OWT76556.1 hypothetical protein CEY05_15945 [Achromobacter sp. HZ34]